MELVSIQFVALTIIISQRIATFPMSLTVSLNLAKKYVGRENKELIEMFGIVTPGMMAGAVVVLHASTSQRAQWTALYLTYCDIN